ncbi:hypothetical protein [Actinomyces haliotis]|uniref:hypothetical protein n=1 Tax=Actinomyces haliotis TaxID=1280843 RepID=UPI00188F6FE6|nr:hypothetical protein [Actinomyces haliotis]
MTLTGQRTEDGGARLEATYLEVWGWQVEVTLGDAEATMVMRNVVPEPALGMLPQGDPSSKAGPYDAMVARWVF